MNATETTAGQRKLFWACFIALCATSFAFILRIMAMDGIADEFGLDETQKGEIFGVGIWPFAVSIVLFSLVIDKIGYGKAILFAFLAHVGFAVMMVTATGYWTLYIASGLGGLAAGAIEAAINPIVATMFPKQKTKWLNILHAGWPGGMVAAGLLALALGGDAGIGWKGQIGLTLIPVLAYGAMMMRCKFPPNERVAAGVSYRAMLQEVGFLGCLITSVVIFLEIGRVVGWDQSTSLIIAGALSIAFGAYTHTLGRPLFLILMLIMMPLAITELGTDSWITSLMTPPMEELGLPPVMVLIYTSLLMMILRFQAGPIVDKLSPLGLLAASAGFAIIGLTLFSTATGIMILAAATIYGVGKTFFWPTMLGVVSEQFPRGGALTLNLIAGLGMLSAGVIGNALLGNIQDQTVEAKLQENAPAIHQQVVGEEKTWIFGEYRAIEQGEVANLSEAEQETVTELQREAKKSALSVVALFPGLMLVAYLVLIGWFRSRGGYRPIELMHESDSSSPEAT